MIWLGRAARLASSYLIVGNGIAGTVAAQRIREAEPDADVIIFANEPYPIYNRIALPPFLKRKIKKRKMTIHDFEWHSDRCIDLKLNCTVTRIDPKNHRIETDEGREYVYDKLLVATGGRPHPLDVPGMPTGAVFNFQTMDDTLGLDARIEESKTAAVIGGSYIAYELAEAFNARGLKVSWVMRGPWFLRRLLEQEGGQLVDRIADDHGVEIVHGDTIGGVESGNGTISGIVTNGGLRRPADILGVGLGVKLNTECLDGSGVETRSGIVTDEYLRTNVPDIIAAGDVAEFFDLVLEAHNTMGTWDNATNHGKVAAANMLGELTAYESVPTYSTTLFHSRIAAFGATPESDPTLESVFAIDKTNATYRRLFFRGNHLVGGVIIGKARGRARLIRMIKDREEISPSERESLLTV